VEYGSAQQLFCSHPVHTLSGFSRRYAFCQWSSHHRPRAGSLHKRSAAKQSQSPVPAGNFMLLDVIGVAAPMDLYAQVPADGQERFSGLIRRNDELAASVREKNAVVTLLKRSLQTVNQSFNQASDPELDRRLHFFGEETTVRRVYLRLLAHTHEQMGQMIAYLRFSGIAPPWPDWRPDRRTQS